MIKLPGQVGYKQTNRSDLLGSLWSSFNIDLQSNLGRARVAPRLKINSQVSDLANLGVPVAFKYFGGAFRAVAGARVFNGGATPNAAFTQDGTASTPTTCSSDSSDMEVFNGKLYVTTQTTLDVNGSGGSFGAWSSTTMTLSSGVPHITRYFEKFNRLYVTNGSSIQSIDTANTVASSGSFYISLPFGSLIMSMETTPTDIWIGTQSKDVACMHANVFRWDGISAQASNVYPINAKGIFAISINQKTGQPTIIDSNGIISEFNGSGFSEVARLPYTNILPYNDDGLVANKFIHFNGLVYTKNDTFLALINNLNNNNSATINENLPSGIWECSKESGLVHKYPFTYNTAASSSVIDWGQNRISRVGGLMIADIPSTVSGRNGTLLAGASIYTDATTTTNAIFLDDSNDTVQKAGYFVSTKIQSEGITDSWNKVFAKYRQFLASTDRMVIKYRTVEQEPTEMTITWVAGSTQFTTTDANMANYAVGDEVEIIQGSGSGMCSHITVISVNAGTYTVTLDLTHPTSTATAKARLQKWIKLGTVSDQTSSFKEFAFPQNLQKTWIQFKVWVLFTGRNEFEELNVVRTPYQIT